tara:strand:- start:2523 stop:3653 length:1131 start_codon:yes stop_codon:yes gene_type:complete
MSYMSLLILGLMDNIRGPFYPDLLSDLSLSATKGSLFFAVASFAALGGNFLGSFLLGKVTAHGLMNFSVMGLGVGFYAIGWSEGFQALIGSCILFGVHFGLLNVAQNVVVQKNAPLMYRRRIFNGLHAMYGLAALMAPLLASGFIEVGWNWKKSFMAVGLISALMGFSFLIFGFSWKEEKLQSEEHADNQQPLHWKPALLLATALAVYIMGELSLSTRYPLWVRESLGLSAQSANFYLALFCGGLFLGRLLFTFVHFHSLSNKVILALSAGLGMVAYALGLLVHPVMAGFAGFFMGPFFPVALDEMSHRFGIHASRVIGWSITLGSVLVVTMHFVLGVLTDHYGIERSLWMGPSALLGAVILILLFPKGSDPLQRD